MQEVGHKGLQEALACKGVELGKAASGPMRKALDEKDDRLLGALIQNVTSSKVVIDSLDIDYKRMVDAGLPYAACMWLRRFDPEPGQYFLQFLVALSIVHVFWVGRV